MRPGAAALARACLPALAAARAPLRPAPVRDLVAAIEGALAGRSRSALREVSAARGRVERDPAWSRARDVPAPVTRARLVALEAATAVGAGTAQRAAEAAGQAAAWAAAGHDVAAVVAVALLPWAVLEPAAGPCRTPPVG
ncbi:MAG: hypothetical protein M9894_33740 [Planctomycetes bacterium]|nr:hypothetical protein [Planctomycetota bacterium]